mgnify:CR=1 FL=1
MTTNREVIEGLLYQGRYEQIAYKIDVSAWDATPAASPVVTAWDITDNAWTNVSAAILASTTGTTAGATLTLPIIANLTPDHRYHIAVRFTGSDSNIYECFFYIQGEH